MNIRRNNPVSYGAVIDRLASQIGADNEAKTQARHLYRNHTAADLHTLKILGKAQARALEMRSLEYDDPNEGMRIEEEKLNEDASEKRLRYLWKSRAIPLAVAARMAVDAKIKEKSDARLLARLESSFK